MSQKALTSAFLQKQTYLSPQKREQIRENIQSLEWALRGQSMHRGMDMPRDVPIPGYSPPEPEILQESLDKEQALYAASTPPAVSPLEKNRLFRRLKELDEKIKHAMPTYDMMEQPTMNNVEHHMAWERQAKPLILERKAILRVLDPDNDSTFFTSVEQLRSSTPPKGNPAKLFQNFDYIQFQQTTEATLNLLDDEGYSRFLELKCAGWADATIQKQLGWTRELYNAAMTRWRQAIVDGAYTKFLELHAAGQSGEAICALLGWTHDEYEAAVQRWHGSIEMPERPAALEPVPEAKEDAPPLEATEFQRMDTAWQDLTAQAGAAVEVPSVDVKTVQRLARRLSKLNLGTIEVAKAVGIYAGLLGRKLSGSVALSPAEASALTAYFDKIEQERAAARSNEMVAAYEQASGPLP